MTDTTEARRFTHLHTHTEYSMLDGISRIPELVRRAKELGMDALAITDHGGMYGTVDFYNACKEEGIKAIIGCEVYVAKGSRFDKNNDERSPHHLVLLAQNNQGYRNLMQLVTRSNTEGFHYKPRIDRELLEKYNEGLIVLSGCASGEIPRLIAKDDIPAATEAAQWYRDTFPGRYFLELQDHQHVDKLPKINEGLEAIGNQLQIPMVVTNDAHYVNHQEAPLQDVYICIQTGTTLQDPKRLRMEDPSYYLKSPEEMGELFPNHPEALSNTNRIADMCDVSLDFGNTHLPKYPTPDKKDADEYLAELCWEGFARRYPGRPQQAVSRLEYELDVIRHTNFANYFLAVWDIIKFVRREHILYGVRGSAAASVALYCLDITNVEPLQYKLVFERFLNLERKEMPDIDMDFQDDRRDEVLQYVIQRYGSDKVAQIITFGTLGAKAALKDTGRALGMAFSEVDRISKLVPNKARTLDEALQTNQELLDIYESEPNVQRLVDTAQGLEGIVHHVSTHAAGVLISEEPLSDTVPLQRPARSESESPILMTQYSMDPVAKLGLLKMDFLGLTNLTILDKAVKLVDEHHGTKVDLDTLSLEDPAAFELLASGNTIDLFQLESGGMRRYIKELQPSNLGDIAAMIALYRPGPMENIDTFINAKFGRAPITYPHPSFKEFLDETYGVTVYQDQVLFILQQFAGYSLGEADIVRKAMGKKIASLMTAERERFITGAMANGYESELAGTVFDLIEPFAGYAFNKAHSISYALISYWTAYFKAHYSLEYMTAVLNSRMDNPDKTAGSINQCFQIGIPVKLPDVNRSHEFFSIEKEPGEPDAIRAGLSAVKTVTANNVQKLLEERRANGPYKSIDEFCHRGGAGNMNRRTIENLARAGAFDSLAPRGAVLSVLDHIISLNQMEARNKTTGQSSLFGGNAAPDSASLPGVDLTAPDCSDDQKAAWETDLIGVALSSATVHSTPVTPEEATTLNALEQIRPDLLGQQVSVIGYISSKTERVGPRGEGFLTANLELMGGAIEIVVWPNVLQQTEGHWGETNVLRITGKLLGRRDRMALVCEGLQRYREDGTPGQEALAAPQASVKERKERKTRGRSKPSSSQQPPPARQPATQTETRAAATTESPPEPDPRPTIIISLTESGDYEQDTQTLRTLVAILAEVPGEHRVNLDLETIEGRVLLDLPLVATTHTNELEARVTEMLGEGSMRITIPEPAAAAAD